MDHTQEAEFTAFVEARYRQLVGVARALTGDWQLAEDLTQAALEKVYRKWSTRSPIGAPYAYTRTVMVHEYVTWKRRHRWRRETLSNDLERWDARTVALDAAGDQDNDLLQGLPRHEKSVLVLRFYEDLSVQEVAIVLGVAEGTVKSRTSRGLDKLRSRLAVDPSGGV